MTGDNVLFKNRYLLGVKRISSRAVGYWYLLGVLFTISEGYPRPFHMVVPLRGKLPSN